MSVSDDAACQITHDYSPIGYTTSVADLLQLIRKGDTAAWEEIIRRYGGVVTAVARSLRLQDADARDVVQMTWLRLLENTHRVRDPQRLAGWLTTTARREALHILRQHVKHTLIPAEVTAENVADRAAGPEQCLMHCEMKRILEDLVAELSPRRQILLRSLFMDNPLSYADVANTFGIPAGAIGPTRTRALRQLRCRLDELGLGPRSAT